MWKSFKVKVEPLTPEAFAPFGEVIESFEEAKPEIAKGGLRSAAYPVTADLSEGTSKLRNPKNAALRRAAASALCLSHRRGTGILSKPPPANSVSGRSYQGHPRG